MVTWLLLCILTLLFLTSWCHLKWKIKNKNKYMIYTLVTCFISSWGLNFEQLQRLPRFSSSLVYVLHTYPLLKPIHQRSQLHSNQEDETHCGVLRFFDLDRHPKSHLDTMSTRSTQDRNLAIIDWLPREKFSLDSTWSGPSPLPTRMWANISSHVHNGRPW